MPGGQQGQYLFWQGCIFCGFTLLRRFYGNPDKGRQIMLKLGPEINQCFMNFYHEVFKDGKLSLKTKELIALAASLAAGCQPCYKAHMEKAKQAGNTDEEIREAIAVAEVLSSGKIRMMVYSVDKQAGKINKKR